MDLKRLGTMVVILVAGLAFFWLYLNSQRQQPQSTPVPQQSPSPSAPASAQTTEPPSNTTAPPASDATTTAHEDGDRWFGPRVGEQVVTIGSPDDPNGYQLQLQVTSAGAGVYTAKLTNYFVTVQDKHLFEEDPQAYQATVAAHPEKYQGHYSVLNPVGPDDAQLLSLVTRRLTVRVTGDNPAELVLEGLDQKPWQLLKLTEDTAEFAYTLYHGANWDAAQANPILRLVKTYTLRKGDYTVYVSLRMENLCGQPMEVALDQLGPTGLPEDQDFRRGSRRQAAVGTYGGQGQGVKVTRQGARELGKLNYGQRVSAGASHESPATLWVGTTNKYFGAMMYLVPAEADRLAALQWRARFYLQAARESGGSKTYAVGMTIPPVTLSVEQPTRQMDLEVFVGPKKRALFTNSHTPGYRQIYKQLSYIDTIDFGSCCTWTPLSLGMMWLLGKLSIVTLGNYGVAIILLVFLVRLALHPITKRGQVSMMKFQKLAPQIQKIKEKYANDKAALNREMMALYKAQGASPLWGCLPMLLQLPIWVALFSSLNAAVELRHAGFLPVWITDLSAPDALWTWPARYSLPLAGHTLNLLPILLTVAMFFQSKTMSSMSQATASPDQARQQKMMQYMFPPMMLLFFYGAPSGLTLYIMASTFAGVIEQRAIRKHIQEREAAAAATETTIRLPGKTPRGQRPKKPRGPFWTKRG